MFKIYNIDYDVKTWTPIYESGLDWYLSGRVWQSERKMLQKYKSDVTLTLTSMSEMNALVTSLNGSDAPYIETDMPIFGVDCLPYSSGAMKPRIIAVGAMVAIGIAIFELTITVGAEFINETATIESSSFANMWLQDYSLELINDKTYVNLYKDIAHGDVIHSNEMYRTNASYVARVDNWARLRKYIRNNPTDTFTINTSVVKLLGGSGSLSSAKVFGFSGEQYLANGSNYIQVNISLGRG